MIAVAEGEPFLRAFVDRAALASDLLFHAVPPSIIGSTLIGIAAMIVAACRVAVTIDAEMAKLEKAGIARSEASALMRRVAS